MKTNICTCILQCSVPLLSQGQLYRAYLSYSYAARGEADVTLAAAREVDEGRIAFTPVPIRRKAAGPSSSGRKASSLAQKLFGSQFLDTVS